MSTHRGRCVVCARSTFCSADEHVLGSGRGGCMRDEVLRIEFCSLACFKELRESMARREEIAKELYPEMDFS